MTTTYMRVIPRDLFNEASLLKCLGRFWIETERYQVRHVTFEHNGDPFEVWQDENDGTLHVRNVEVFINGRPHHLCRPLNSREPWPLYIQTRDDERIAVFTENGKLTPELITLIKGET